MAHTYPVNLPASGKDVTLYVDWTEASSVEQIKSGIDPNNPETLLTSMGKIAKWKTEFKKLVFTDLTTESSGSGNAVTGLSYDNLTGKITYTMGSFATVTSAMRMLNTDPTTSTTYNVLFASPNSSSNNGYFRVNDDFTVLIKKGLANSSGWSALVLGNSTAAGTDGAKYGVVRIYNDGSSYLQFSGIRSDSLVLRASSESITTLNFSPYSTNKYDLGTSTYKWRNVYAGTFNGYTIEKSVPSDALFTDTWEPLTGATSSTNGTVGYINAAPPSDGYNTKYFRADGTWATPTGTYVHPTYTRSDTTSTPAQLAHAGTFTAITSVTSTNGHVTAINTATYKLPAQYTHPTYTRNDTTSTASPAHGDTFTAIDSVTSTNGHVTAVNVKTITLPTQYSHPTYTRSNTTSEASPAHGETFTAIDSITTNSLGHVTAVNTKTVTLPTDQNTDTKVTQTNTTGDADYRVLFSANANNTTETTTSRKSGDLIFNPSTKVLSTGRLSLKSTTAPAITVDLGSLAPTAGQNVNVLTVKFKNSDGTRTHTLSPIAIIGNDATGDGATYNGGVRIGSTSGTTIVAAGDSSTTFAAAKGKYNDENLYLVADDSVLLYRGMSNDSTTGSGPWTVGGFTETPTSGQVIIADGTVGGYKTSGYTIAKSVPSDALFTDTVYTHPTYTAKTTEALYTIKVDTLGHVSTATLATSDTITNLVSTAGVSTLINKLSTGSSTPVDADYYISQYANGGTTTTTYHRRPVSALWTYMKGKADSVYSALGHTHNYAGSSSAGGAATSANKLNTDAGGVIRPVYFSNGVPVACNAPVSGAWWNTVSPVNSSGVLEIGRYIDFHCTSASTNNYDVRLDAGASNKSLIVQCANTTSGPWLTVQGVLPKLKFIQTTSGYEYNKDSCGITAYPGSYDAGLNLIMQSGGNTIIGSGEIASTFMTSLNDGDRSDIIKYPYRWRDYGECAILASDENAYIWTNGASWDSTKKYFLNLHCFVFNANGNFALPVGGGLYYQYGTRDANTGMVNTVVQSGLLSAATTAQTWTLPNATGTIALTSDLSAYIPKAGATDISGILETNSISAGFTSLGNSSRKLSLTRGQLLFTAPNGGWATGFWFYKPDGSTVLGWMGAQGNATSLTYFGMGAEYDDVYMKLEPTTARMTLRGTQPMLKFQQTTSGAAFDNDYCGIIAYPADINGTNMTIQSNGNMIIGSGEYPINWYNLSGKTSVAPDYWSNTGEQTYVGSDNYVIIHTLANTIANRKTHIFGNNLTLDVGSNLIFRTDYDGQSYPTTYPSGGIQVTDLRNVTVTPTSGDKNVNFYFTHGVANAPTSDWCSIIHMRGYTGNYNTWEVAGPSHNTDQRTTPLYVRTSGIVNSTATWGSWRKIYDESNPPTPDEIGSPDIATRGTIIPTNSNLNTYTTPGTYYSENSTKSATITNGPTTGSGYKLYVSIVYGTGRIMQYAIGAAVQSQWMRTSENTGSTWTSWLQITFTDHTHSNYLGASKASTSYYGMTDPDGTDTHWIRTTTQGIIPYQSGNAGSGHQQIGTSTWYFSAAYIDSIYGTTFSGTATNATNATNVYSTLSDPTTEKTYYIDGHETVSSAYKSLKHNDGLSHVTKQGNSGVEGYSIISVGNAIATGTDGNKTGELRLYGKNSYHATLVANASISSDAITYYLPNKTSTATLATTSDIPGKGSWTAVSYSNMTCAAYVSAGTLRYRNFRTGLVEICGYIKPSTLQATYVLSTVSGIKPSTVPRYSSIYNGSNMALVTGAFIYIDTTGKITIQCTSSSVFNTSSNYYFNFTYLTG